MHTESLHVLCLPGDCCWCCTSQNSIRAEEFKFKLKYFSLVNCTQDEAVCGGVKTIKSFKWKCLVQFSVLSHADTTFLVILNCPVVTEHLHFQYVVTRVGLPRVLFSRNTRKKEREYIQLKQVEALFCSSPSGRQSQLFTGSERPSNKKKQKKLDIGGPKCRTKWELCINSIQISSVQKKENHEY